MIEAKHLLSIKIVIINYEIIEQDLHFKKIKLGYDENVIHFNNSSIFVLFNVIMRIIELFYVIVKQDDEVKVLAILEIVIVMNLVNYFDLVEKLDYMIRSVIV